MTVLTKRAVEIFAPTTEGGAPRGPVMGDVQTWGTELEDAVLATTRVPMTPATAVARFATPGTSSFTWAFAEFLWEQEPSGRVNCHVEFDTVEIEVEGVTYGPGTFTKGTGSGLFSIYYGQDLAPHAEQFWWPEGATQSVQPPLQTGQGRWGFVRMDVGIAAAVAAAGITKLTPRTVGQLVVLEKYAVGSTPALIQASDFITSGDVRLYFEFGYMADPPV